MIESHLLSLEALCRSKGVKLLAVRAYGLMGYIRVRIGGGGGRVCVCVCVCVC